MLGVEHVERRRAIRAAFRAPLQCAKPRAPSIGGPSIVNQGPTWEATSVWCSVTAARQTASRQKAAVRLRGTVRQGTNRASVTCRVLGPRVKQGRRQVTDEAVCSGANQGRRLLRRVLFRRTKARSSAAAPPHAASPHEYYGGLLLSGASLSTLTSTASSPWGTCAPRSTCRRASTPSATPCASRTCPS